MGGPTGLITKATAGEYNKVIMETSEGKRYYSDLSPFKKVVCYPDENDWPIISIDSYGLDLIWPSRFEVHITQVIDHSYKVEDIKQAG